MLLAAGRPSIVRLLPDEVGVAGRWSTGSSAPLEHCSPGKRARPRVQVTGAQHSAAAAAAAKTISSQVKRLLVLSSGRQCHSVAGGQVLKRADRTDPPPRPIEEAPREDQSNRIESNRIRLAQPAAPLQPAVCASHLPVVLAEWAFPCCRAKFARKADENDDDDENTVVLHYCVERLCARASLVGALELVKFDWLRLD